MLDIRVPVYCHPSTPILTEIDCSLLENQMEFSLYENYIHHNFGKLNFNTFISLIIVSSLINDNIMQFIVERNIFSQPLVLRYYKLAILVDRIDRVKLS